MAETEVLRKRIMVTHGHRLVLRNKISKAKELLPSPTAEIFEDARAKLEAKKTH